MVVETIDFYNEEDESLPAPLSLADVVAQLRAAPAETQAQAEPAEAAMEVEMDEEERVMLSEGGAAGLHAAPPPAHAPEPQMKIVRNYKRPGAAAAAGADSGKFVVSPITGELVPVDQMAEHMRISLIDPKWKEQREAMLGKLRGSSVASDEEIAKNVVRLARTRPDIFGSTDEEVSNAMSAELEAKKSTPLEAQRAPGPPIGARPGGPMPPHGGMQMLPPGVQQRPPGMPPGMPMPMPPRPYGAPPPGMPGMPHGFPPQGGMPPPLPPGAMPPRPPGAPPMPPYAQQPPPYGMPMHGMPLPGAHAPPLPPGDEPDAKRARKDEAALLSEEDFAEANPGTVSIEVTVPDVEGDAALNGQTVTLEVASVMETVGDVKARLAAAIGVAASKQKLSTPALGFLKESSTLAAYNFGTGTAMTMGLKERGGRTKK